MSQRFSDRLEAFYKYWDDKVREGLVSGLSGTECMVLEIYDDWLREYENQNKK